MPPVNSAKQVASFFAPRNGCAMRSRHWPGKLFALRARVSVPVDRKKLAVSLVLVNQNDYLVSGIEGDLKYRSVLVGRHQLGPDRRHLQFFRAQGPGRIDEKSLRQAYAVPESVQGNATKVREVQVRI